MWNKKQIANLTCWSPIPNETVEVICDLHDAARKLTEDSDKYTLYYQSQAQLLSVQTPSEIKQIPAGIYQYATISDTKYLVEFQIQEKDQILELKHTKPIIDDFYLFEASKQLYQTELKLPYRRGILLYGPPGTGKTFTLHKLIEHMQSSDRVIIFCPAKVLNLTFLEALKKDDRLKIIIFEEFTNALVPDHFEVSGSMLDFLDGETSLNNCFIIASTNYPEKLPGNIVRRPGRFDKFYKVGYLIREDISRYMQHYEVEASDRLLKEKELTIAQLKEILLLVKRDQKTVDQALDALIKHRELVDKEFSEKKQKIGFGFSRVSDE